MKSKYVPLDKQSKRKRKEYYTAQRKDWGTINPVTKKTSNLKAYSRKKTGQWYEYEPLSGFFLHYYTGVSPLRISIDLFHFSDIIHAHRNC